MPTGGSHVTIMTAALIQLHSPVVSPLSFSKDYGIWLHHDNGPEKYMIRGAMLANMSDFFVREKKG